MRGALLNWLWPHADAALCLLSGCAMSHRDRSRPLRRLQRRRGAFGTPLVLLIFLVLAVVLKPAAAATKKAQGKKAQGKKKDPYANSFKQLFWLQDPRDNTCLGPTGFGVCDESSVWMTADRKEGMVFVAPFETGNVEMCLVRKWCHWAESPVGLGSCKHCGAKHWSVSKDRRGYVKIAEHDGRNCLVRSRPRVDGKKASGYRQLKNTVEMQHCDKGYTGLVLAKAPISSEGFFLQAADGFCFDGERFVACDTSDWRLRWGVGVRVTGGGQAERYFYKVFDSDVCLHKTGKGPRLGDCAHGAAKRWTLQNGRLAKDGQCIARQFDNSAVFVKCSLNLFEHVSPVPYESSLASPAASAGVGIPVGGGGGGRLPLGY